MQGKWEDAWSFIWCTGRERMGRRINIVHVNK
jgi:hypothetical protein